MARFFGDNNAWIKETLVRIERYPLMMHAVGKVYCDGNQPLPTYDELLTCTPETTFEEVELLIRRAMQAGDKNFDGNGGQFP
ncbi:hypothetical protein JZ751_001972 [Albula glossodonta]|uniref:Uncharacterized protein n=1 Tax=Albula glossodonta TaxID=121402 RepID=A0A8T2PHG0_9TELE|nr:hypothetical protein JZ751_001972 [Albula glossodonta]